MNWDAIGAIGETVGALAVVVSLLYLALQMRSNSKALRADAAWNAEFTFGVNNSELSRNPEYCGLLARALKPDADASDFTEGEMTQLLFLMRGTWQLIHAQWLSWREGSLPGNIWDLRKRTTRPLLDLPLIREFWENEKKQGMFLDNFVKEIESAQSSLSPIPSYLDTNG
jgi:hypothetical protein